MKIEKKTVQSGILKLEKNVQITIDQDMNVPDTKPDVERWWRAAERFMLMRLKC